MNNVNTFEYNITHVYSAMGGEYEKCLEGERRGESARQR